MLASFLRTLMSRPVSAWMTVILAVVCGAIAVLRMPVRPCPGRTAVEVVVTAVYPGAAAELVAETVAAPIESQLGGLEGMVGMASKSDDGGRYELTVAFEPEREPDRAVAEVKGRVETALSQLPDEVRRQGVAAAARAGRILLVINLFPERYDQAQLAGFAATEVRDALGRVPGVGKIEIFGGGDLAVRIRLDPSKLATRELTAGEAVAAIRRQCEPVVAGQIGAAGAAADAALCRAVSGGGRFGEVAEFEGIVLKSDAAGPGEKSIYCPSY